MEVHIKQCRLRHLAAATDLFEQYRRFYRMPADHERAREFLAARLKHQDSVFLMAADANGQPVGFTQLYPMFSSTRMVVLWVLNDLFVVPSARGKGVGRRLMEAARERAVQQGVGVLALATEKDNATAKRLYQSLGYVLDKTFDHYELTLHRPRRARFD